MHLQGLVDLVHSGRTENWAERCKKAFAEIYGSASGRYPQIAEPSVRLRPSKFKDGKGVTFAALIDQSNPDSGAYGGMSFVICPREGRPALISMIVGTQGLSPDEEILGRPGHGRKVAAICSWLNREYGQGQMVAWAKQDPARIDLDIPGNIQRLFTDFQPVFKRYGRVIYGFYVPGENQQGTADALKAFLDLLFAERGFAPLKGAIDDAGRIKAKYHAHLFPDCTSGEVARLLRRHKYVVLQGPPGTGKTRMALDLLKRRYGDRGKKIQFHPNTTYESFVGGLAPLHTEEGLGLQFAPEAGFLMKAAAEAAHCPDKPYLLMIDEINRADLAKVLGEAIFLLEAREQGREIELPYDFGDPFHRRLSLPENLHIIGTMNSSDRSIAIVDVAVRRRFAFQRVWPQRAVVEAHGCDLMQQAFGELLDTFIEYADEEALALLPGHSYFLESDAKEALASLRTNLDPLLREYLEQGYVTAFADSIRAYLQWLESLEE